MRPEESAYWDHVAVAVKGQNVDGLTDNVHKRCEIVRRVLAFRPVNAKILEIGVGQGTTAAAVRLTLINNWEYVGTDVSKEFCSFAKRMFGVTTVQTDVLRLPDGPFDMIWAFDSLEHVRPEDRAAGNKEISRVMAEHGLILINSPCDETQHELEFDWGTTEQDIIDLAQACGCFIFKMERYYVPEVDRTYMWSVLQR